MAMEVLAWSSQRWEHREHTPGLSREFLKGRGVKEGQATIESYAEKGARFRGICCQVETGRKNGFLHT